MTSTSATDWHEKGIWPALGRLSGDELVASGRTLFDGSIAWPAMILRERALSTNIEALATFCREHELAFAPHGKTTMSPEIFQRQIEAGAWGITVATSQQVRVAFGYGVQRVFLANEMLDSTALDAIVEMLLADNQREFLCLVDSAEGVRAIAAAGERLPQLVGGLSVLIDLGWAGGRTGVRNADEALALARAVAQTPRIRLAGVSSYEGGLGSPEAVRAYFGQVRAAVEAMRAEGILPEHPIVSAGGSAYFDLVAAELASDWAPANGVRVMLRSGAYVSHDDGVYVGKTAFNRIPGEGHLESALEIWAQVVSAPEPGLVIVGMGKRDAPYDEGMPVPKMLRREGAAVLEPVGDLAWVSGMDDQHAYLRLDGALDVRPGDLVSFGISHPCTAFDKWRVVPMLDDDDRIVELARCYF